MKITADNILRFCKAEPRHYEHIRRMFDLNKPSRVKRWQTIADNLVAKGKLERSGNAYSTAKGAAPVDDESGKVQIQNQGAGKLLFGIRL